MQKVATRCLSNPRHRVLLLGYGGANNTGADIRILTVIDDVRAAFGADCAISVATVDRANTARTLEGIEGIDIVELPYVFPLELWRAVARHDVLMLVEGSTFKENWSSALLYLYLWGAWCAKRLGKAAVAYAVDAGPMNALHRFMVRKVCNELDLIIVRTGAAKRVLRELGVRRDIEITTDTAFQFHVEPVPEAEPVVGMAPVEFFHWPVRVRLWGPAEHCYHWPYYFSWDRRRAASSDNLVSAWVDLIRYVVEEKGFAVRLVAMEQLDQRMCERILRSLPPAISTRVYTSYAGQTPPKRIVEVLRGLDYLVTSRYHAGVLSMEGRVPQIALFHDERLPALYEELGLSEFAIPHTSSDLGGALRRKFADLIVRRDELVHALGTSLEGTMLPRCRQNRRILADWLAHASLSSTGDSAP